MKERATTERLKRCCAAAGLIIVCMPVMAEEGARLALGEKVFLASCKSCHDTGKPQNDAPQLSERAEWKDRAGKGRAELYKSAIEGFTGYYAMPARGGNAALSDEEVKAAVDYMLLRAGAR